MLPLLLACTSSQEPSVEALETRATAHRLADLGMARWPVEDMPFDWMQTVWAYAVYELGEPPYTTYSQDWMLDNVDRFDGTKEFHSSDSMSPALLASLAMGDDPSLELTPITDAAHVYLASAPRTEAGAIEHWADGLPFGEIGQVWVDSQFMFGMFLLGEYDRTGDTAYLDQWVEQYDLFSEHCRDPQDQLYRHAWDDWNEANIPVEAVYWNRGNSWVLVSAAEFLVRDTGHADHERIAEQFQAHADATLALQADDGLWWTVLNHPDEPANYTETSGSALIGYALARGVEAGALDDEVYGPPIREAAIGTLERVDGDVVEGTSFGTNPGDLDYYLSVTQLDDIILGVGSVVLFLDEVDL